MTVELKFAALLSETQAYTNTSRKKELGKYFDKRYAWYVDGASWSTEWMGMSESSATKCTRVLSSGWTNQSLVRRTVEFGLFSHRECFVPKNNLKVLKF